MIKNIRPFHTLCVVILLGIISVVACNKTESKEDVTAQAAIVQTEETDPHTPEQTPSQAAQDKEHDMAKNPKLNVGDQAPEWTLDSDNAGEVTSSSLKGQKYILYFYPKDNTKGCTLEAIDFQENEKKFAEKGYKVFGISADGIDSHKEFRDEHNLEFTLLSDPDHKVAEAFGVWRMKNNYGKEALGTVRSTFVIDENGKITQIHDNVRATGHVERLLEQI